MWPWRVAGVLRIFSQWGHGNWFPPWWVNLWNFNFWFVVYAWKCNCKKGVTKNRPLSENENVWYVTYGNIPYYTWESRMENFSDWFFFLLPGQHCWVDSIPVSVRALQYAPVDEIWAFVLYVFENHICRKQIVYLVYM